MYADKDGKIPEKESVVDAELVKELPLAKLEDENVEGTGIEEAEFDVEAWEVKSVDEFTDLDTERLGKDVDGPDAYDGGSLVDTLFPGY